MEPNVKVVSVLRSVGAGPGRTELRVVSWNDNEPVLEKRQFIKDSATGAIRPGKCRGLTLKDVSFVVSNWPDIHASMASFGVRP